MCSKSNRGRYISMLYTAVVVAEYLRNDAFLFVDDCNQN